MKLEEFKTFVNGKKVAVIGLGISNRPLIGYLLKNGAEVVGYDRRTSEQLGDIYNEMTNLGVSLITGDNYMERIDGDIIFKTPGMRYDHPAIEQARKNGSFVTSEMEMFFELCPAKIIAVTGSDGKTTTTTLINEMLKKAGYKTWLGGNIGKPLLADIDNIMPDDRVVLELSSFQLHTMRKSPQIAVITNISPNHLDFHKDYDEYIDAKKNIMRYQSSEDRLVTNISCAETKKIVSEAVGQCVAFSSKEKGDIYIENGVIMYGNEPVLEISDIKIPGMHNVENYMAAIGAVYGLVGNDEIRSVAREFGGVEHRIELVRIKDNVRYYNSSIDSSPNRTINTLRVFKDKVIMISGGKDKGIPYDEIGPSIADKVKVLILIGMTSDKIEEALNKTGRQDEVEVIRVSSYEEAVSTAENKAQSGDVVLLSPASTSFDMFANFEERGNLFKKLVNAL